MVQRFASKEGETFFHPWRWASAQAKCGWRWKQQFGIDESYKRESYLATHARPVYSSRRCRTATVGL